MAGAIISSTAGYFYIKYEPKGFLHRFAESFISRNPKVLVGYEDTPEYIQHLIKKGERETVEFKSTLRTNLHTKQIDKKIEHAVLKTIVAFLNTDGGVLLVGVSDTGKITGIAQDNFPNLDSFYRHFTNLIKKHIGNEFLPFITSEIVHVEDRDVLKIECLRSTQEVFLKSDTGEDFYVRSGPSTAKLSGSKLVAYVTQRFRKE